MGLPIPSILTAPELEAMIETHELDPSLYFLSKIKEENFPEEIIRWMVAHRGYGMAPIIARGAQSPIYAGDGMSEMSSAGALISEKIYVTEYDINRCLSNNPLKQKAGEKIILDKLERLFKRHDLRKEWLWAQLYFNHGVVNYQDDEGGFFNMNYHLSTDMHVELTGTNVWLDGSTRDVAGDIENMNDMLEIYTGQAATSIMMTKKTLRKVLKADEQIQALLANDKFGDRNGKESLMTKPLETLKQWFDDVPFEIYDGTYPMSTKVMQTLSTTEYVLDDVSALEKGATIQFARVGINEAKKENLGKIKAVSKATSQIELEDAVAGIVAHKTQCLMNVPFLKENRLVFTVDKVGGEDAAQWINAPLGFGSKYGVRINDNDNFDPDAKVNRVRGLGAPILKHTGTIGTLDVRE